MFEVFISFKNLAPNREQTRDSQIAAQLYDTLTNAGVSTFFSNVEIQRKADPRWGRMIDSALREATVMVVVGTCTEYVESEWVDYEWRYFSEQIRSGANKQLITVLEGLHPSQLPPAFAGTQSYGSNNIAGAVDMVRGILCKRDTASYTAVPNRPRAFKTAAPTPQAPVNKPVQSSLKVGDYIKLGSYPQSGDTPEPIEWRVLEVRSDGSALLISKYAIDNAKYNETQTSVTWETCTLRRWLNNDFINKAFTADEQRRIQAVTLQNLKNPEYGTEGGSATQDKVFCLSIDEVNRYFDSDDERVATSTKYAKKHGAYLGKCWWWFRSPGLDNCKTASINGDGCVFVGGYSVDSDYISVRPALFIRVY